MAAPVTALYVGDLHPDVEDGALFDLFSSIGPLASVRVCRDSASGLSLGYGYVNFMSSQDAFQAIEKLNHTHLKGKPIRVMLSHRDPDARNSGVGNLFVKNLSQSIDNTRFYEIFSGFGTIVSCKIVVNQDGKSRGYGFVQFDSQESANSAIEKLNGTTVDDKQIYVGNFIRKSERVIPNPEAKYTNLYMKNLDQDITEELIELKFSEFGKILNVMIAKDSEGNSRGFGFVNFENPDSAKRAMETMNGAQLGSKTLYVGRAQKKAERQQILRRVYEEKHNEQIRKNMASNLYVKNIDDGVDDNVLRELFTQCGNITSAKVMLDDKGLSKGFGFVCFNTPEEANKAVNTLHGQMFHGKPLYVSIAQRKEDRRARLLFQYAQRVAGIAAPPAVIPAGYPPLYYAAPGVIPQMSPQQGLMFQQFGLRPGWRPTGFLPPPRPAFQPMPLPTMQNTARQNRQNRGRANGYMPPHSGQLMPYIPHMQQPSSPNSVKDSNSHQWQRPAKYVPNGRQHQHEMNNGLITPRGLNSQEISSMLASSSPEQQKRMLGELLYPLVEKLKCDLASKITGMLLEMDNSELLLLLESPESLSAKVEEAVRVLEVANTRVGGQENLHPSNFLSAQVIVN